MRAVVRGRKTFPPRKRTQVRARLPETPKAPQLGPESTAPVPPNGKEMLAQRPNYARELRAIGQELERRRFTLFNLKCSDGSYFVWSTENIAQFAPTSAANGVGWNTWQSDYGSPDDPATKMLLDRVVGVLFNRDEVNRLERDGVQNRRRVTGVTNGRGLSHLLRTIGDQVYRRNQRLLAIAWQERQISVVAENVRGGRELNVLRTDNLYDLWVRMYLQRSH
jgi:hypothetical protein